MQETYRKRWVPSLFSISIERIFAHLHRFKGALQYIPMRAKERLLRKFLLEGNSHKNCTSNEILSDLVYPSLKAINFSSIKVDDDTLNIVKTCVGLTEIQLRNCGNLNVTSSALKELFGQTKKLIVLDIAHCKEFNDDVLIHLATNCPEIRELCAEGCDLTDAGFDILTRSNRELKRITISETKITGEAIRCASSLKNCCLLQELRLDNCVNVDDEVLKTIVHCCPKIEILTFYNCAIKDQTTIFQDISINCKNLKQLHWTIPW